MATTTKENAKIYYLDNIKVFLTMLVIFHHALVTYGGPGSWYYNEKTASVGATLAMTVIVAVNQAFFMGFFFFMSALFTESSFDRKGAVQFWKDRMIRLGIPLAFYSFILAPFLSYMVYNSSHPLSYRTYLTYYDEWIAFGVLWFVAALLFFSLVFTFFKTIGGSTAGAAKRSLPQNKTIIVFAVAVGLASYAVRILFPVGWVLQPVGWQLGHFPQYIAMFCIGIVAARNGWLQSPELSRVSRLRALPWIVGIVGFVGFFLIKKYGNAGVDAFTGGTGAPAFFYACWEQVIGILLMALIMAVGREKWNVSSPLLKILGRCAFGAYIFHPLWLIGMSVAMKHLEIDPAMKLLIVTPIAIVLSFGFTRLLLLIPRVDRVL